MFTENSTNNEENANDDDYENPSTARANINNNNHKKKRAPENVEVENKVFKLCDTDRLKHRSRSLILIDQNANVDPLCDAERKKMRNDRLDMFFGRADFDVSLKEILKNVLFFSMYFVFFCVLGQTTATTLAYLKPSKSIDHSFTHRKI